jgi:pyridoxine 5-phosphate synthase
MTKLSVNLNKVALLRNQRDIGYPDLVDHATLVLNNGAHGITVHPRPDERHVRQSDIPELAEFLKDKDDIEFNIEGYPSGDFLDLVTTHDCDQVTLVPDDPNQSTSDHGWDVVNKQGFLKPIIERLQNAGRRVSLFLDPEPALIDHVVKTGADRIELYTGPYAENEIAIEMYAETAKRAIEANLGVNAGHDLNLDNLAKFLIAVPDCAEVSIGHAITADALKMGWPAAVAAYLTAIKYAQNKAPKEDAA